MHIVPLFPEDMDIERNLRGYLGELARRGQARHRRREREEWRAIATDQHTTRRGLALRELYKKRMGSMLGYTHIANRDRAVRNSADLDDLEVDLREQAQARAQTLGLRQQGRAVRPA